MIAIEKNPFVMKPLDNPPLCNSTDQNIYFRYSLICCEGRHYAVLLNYRIYAMFPSGLKLKNLVFVYNFYIVGKIASEKDYNYVRENLGENEHMLTFP